MNTKKYFKKIISLAIICILIFTPVVDFAQTVDTTNAPKAIPVEGASINPDFVNSQIQNSINTTSVVSATSTKVRLSTASDVQSYSGMSNVPTSVSTCLGSQIISAAITSLITTSITSATEKIADSVFNVPVAESGAVSVNIKTQTSAQVGGVASAGGFGGIVLPSWDSVAYCIVNSMIAYIADSTLLWITTGFEGNPAFLEDPDQFFKDIADQEKRAFIQDLAYGANSSVCTTFKGPIISSLLSRYGRNQRYLYNQTGFETGGFNRGIQGSLTQSNPNMCTFDQSPGQLNLFLNGSFTEGGGWNSWFQLTQNPVNNPYDTYFRVNQQLNANVEAVKLSNERELNWNNGYLSFRKCEGGDKTKCSITTPGSVIQGRLEKTLNLGTDRLILAQKFDQVVTALVDQLITTALDKTFEAVNGN